MSTETYNTVVQNKDLVRILAKLESAVRDEERDNVIVACLTLVLCLSDPSLPKDEERFRSAIEDTSQYICWMLDQRTIDPKKAN